MTQEMSFIKIERAWSMPTERTFSMIPVARLIEEEKLPGIMIDPFPFGGEIDCFDYLKQFKNESVDFGVLDPPYSKRQISEHYKAKNIKVTGWHTSSGWTASVKDEVARIIKPGGKCITFAWNSVGLGMSRGFEITRILLVSHGGDHNDTICTVERKVQATLDRNGSP